MFWIILHLFPEVGSLGQKADPFLNFLVISILFSTVAALICIPTNSSKELPFLHILDSTCCLLIYWWQPFWQVWDGIWLRFSFVFLCWLMMLSAFAYVYWPSVCSLWRSVYSGPLTIFLIRLFDFFNIEFYEFFINFGYRPPSEAFSITDIPILPIKK